VKTLSKILAGSILRERSHKSDGRWSWLFSEAHILIDYNGRVLAGYLQINEAVNGT
jgi:hypothetical protein